MQGSAGSRYPTFTVIVSESSAGVFSFFNAYKCVSLDVFGVYTCVNDTCVWEGGRMACVLLCHSSTLPLLHGCPTGPGAQLVAHKPQLGVTGTYNHS